MAEPQNQKLTHRRAPPRWLLPLILGGLGLVVAIGIFVVWFTNRELNRQAFAAFASIASDVDACVATVETDLQEFLGMDYLREAAKNATWLERNKRWGLSSREAADHVSQAGTERTGGFWPKGGVLDANKYYRIVMDVPDPSADYSVDTVSRASVRFVDLVDVTIELHADGKKQSAWVTLVDNGDPRNDVAIEKLRACMAARGLDVRVRK